MRRAQQYTEYLVIRICVCILQTVPLEKCDSVARIVARLAVNVFRIRHRVITENLQFRLPRPNAASASPIDAPHVAPSDPDGCRGRPSFEALS